MGRGHASERKIEPLCLNEAAWHPAQALQIYSSDTLQDAGTAGRLAKSHLCLAKVCYSEHELKDSITPGYDR